MMGPTEPVVSGGVISYNGDSERGWNDPPTLPFTGVTASKKAPKLDLRKRVSHQEALTGRKITSPSNQNYSNLYNQANQLTNGLSKLTLEQQQTAFQPIQPSVSPAISPCHSRHSSGSFTPPLATECQNFAAVAKNPSQCHIESPISACSQPSVVNLPSKHYSMDMQVPETTGVINTLTLQTTSTPKVSSPPSLPSKLGQPLFSFPNSLNMLPVSSALDSTHVRSNPDILVDTSQHTKNSMDERQLSANTSLVFSSQETTPVPLIFTPSPTGINNFTTSSNDPVGKTSPVLNKTYPNGPASSLHTSPSQINGSGRDSPSVFPAPPLHVINKSPTSTPTRTHSPCNTSRSTTPDKGFRSTDGSRHNSEDFDSQEAIKVTSEALEETIIKCSSILKNREVEDVRKKLEIMKQQWLDEKLSLPVKMSMKLLAKALLDDDPQTAHKLHVQLMVDYVGEVKQWMVAIKRLITATGNLNVNTQISQ